MKVLSFEPKEGINAQAHRKEDKFYYEYLLINRNMRKIASLRLYSTGQTIYACLWIMKDDWASGSGKAGGWGYHKASAAASEAFRTAGFKFDEEISGRGESAVQDALLAVAAHLNEDCVIFTAHG